MSDTTKAWLLKVGPELKFVVAEHEISEYLVDATLHPIPQAPNYASSMIFWRNLIIPVVKFAPGTDSRQTSGASVVVLAYQDAPKEPLQYIAIEILAAPEKISISDDDACDWPESFPEIWTPLVLALVEQNNQTLAIVDINKLVSEEFSHFATSLADSA